MKKRGTPTRPGTPRTGKPGRTPRGARRARPETAGAPPAEIDIGQVEAAASIGCTIDEIAAVLRVGRSTLYDRIQVDPALKDAIERGREHGKATLRRAQWHAAIGRAPRAATPDQPADPGLPGNPTMQIWLGKQMLGQKDKTEHSVDEGLEALLDRLAAREAAS